MEIKNAEFIACCVDYRKCPPGDLPEYAFIGRSNVGKSSLINCLCNRQGLAKTSSTPGKTQCIVHFLIDNAWHIADLPGYGYAQTGKKLRGQWQKMTRDYLLKRSQLYCVFVLVDLRIPPQKIDLEFLRFLGESEVPFCIVGTKADKLGRNALAQSVQNYQKVLSETWEPLPPFIVSSAETGLGRDEILAFIDRANNTSD
ncbi:MAG: ribosome biogenesis GTP-binding protein YihA/YsxC [Bacteroides sp.]|nr:ribosome biogenesis GTP-binding protein YihA/YsxC [Bacteroides sp.]MCM1084807.1 ribosome biogenesis GTP-binding protein YihA/YsxC [Bacteroides sp.]